MSAPRSAAGPAIARGSSLFALWVVLMQSAEPIDLAVGAIATVLATLASLRLLPPDAGHIRFLALVVQVPRFLWQSLVAGVDVAWRALAPGATLRTGFVDYRTGFPRGQARNVFATITSLMPGTVPSGDGPESIEFHCLDVGQPILEQMADEERRLATALVPGEPHA